MGLSCPVHHYESKPPNTWPLSLCNNLPGTSAERIQEDEELGPSCGPKRPLHSRSGLIC